MNDDSKFIISEAISILGVTIAFLQYIQFGNISALVFSFLFVLFGVLIILMYMEVKREVNFKRLLQFLFFGDEYNKFNMLPKILLFKELVHKINKVSVNCLKVKYSIQQKTDGNDLDATWSFYNINNKTSKNINEYFFYTANDLGMPDKPNIIYSEGNNKTPITLSDSSVFKCNDIRMIPITFKSPIEPGKSVGEFGISLKIYNAFDFSKDEIIYVIPINYAKKISSLEIDIEIKDDKDLNIASHHTSQKLNIVLRRIRKIFDKYQDEQIQCGLPDNKEGINYYHFELQGKEFKMQDIYYFKISPVLIELKNE